MHRTNIESGQTETSPEKWSYLENYKVKFRQFSGNESFCELQIYSTHSAASQLVWFQRFLVSKILHIFRKGNCEECKVKHHKVCQSS